MRASGVLASVIFVLAGPLGVIAAGMFSAAIAWIEVPAKAAQRKSGIIKARRVFIIAFVIGIP
jgi:hypothetical protein